MIAPVLALIATLAGAQADPGGYWVKGRVEGYRGIYPFHVAVLASRDLADPRNPVAWGTADRDTGRFDIAVHGDLKAFYLLGVLDLERVGLSLNGRQTFFLKNLPYTPDEVKGKRLIFDLGDMEMAHVVRDAGSGSARWFALGLGVLVFGVGFLLYRRLAPSPRVLPPPPPLGGPWLWAIALGTTLPLLWKLGTESLGLLEFTYVHEALRPPSIAALLFDPISAELSHPPLWALILRTLAHVTRAEWWLRTPSVLLHLGYVLLVYRLGAEVAGRRIGLLAALLGGLAPIVVYYGRDATPYALLGVLSAGALLCVLRERWALFCTLIVLGFFAHYTMAVLGLALAVALVWHHAKERDSGRMRRTLVAFGVIAVLPLGWSVHFIRTFLASGMSTRLMSADYIPDPGFTSYVGQIASIVLGVPPALAVLAPAVLLLVLYGATRTLRAHALFGRIAIVLLVMVVCYLLFTHAMYVQFGGGRVYYGYRWAIVFLPGVAVASAMGLGGLWRRSRALGGVAAAAVLGLGATVDARLVLSPQRPDQWAAARTMHEDERPGDAFCALPAVYYAQTFNYSVYERQPADMLAWPEWHGALFGPFHQHNTTIETLSRNLAFGRVWVAVFHEQMFDTAEFDPEPAEHQVEWLKAHLIPDGEWPLDYLTLYRFKVPRDEAELWKDGHAHLDFAQTTKLFRYFPKLLHTQQTGQIMSDVDVDVRLPVPTGAPDELQVEVEMVAQGQLRAGDLAVDSVPLHESDGERGRWFDAIPIAGPVMAFLQRLAREAEGTVEDKTVAHVELEFQKTRDGGKWSGWAPVRGGFLNLRLRRSEESARGLLDTHVRAWLPAAAKAGP